MLDWSNAQNIVGSSPYQKDLYNSTRTTPPLKPIQPLSIEIEKPTLSYGILSQLKSDQIKPERQIKPEQIKLLFRHLVTGIKFRSSLAFKNRCSWLSQVEKKLFAHGQRFVSLDPAYLKTVYQLRVAIKKNIKIERLARKNPWLAEMLRIEAIQNVREAYWLNRHYRSQARFSQLNLWRRTDRLMALEQIFFHHSKSSSPITKYQARVILGIVKRLEERKRRQWSEISSEVDKFAVKFVTTLYQQLIEPKPQGRADHQKHVAKEKHGYHFAPLPTPPAHPLARSLRQWPAAGIDTCSGTSKRRPFFEPPTAPYRESQRRFKYQMVDHLVQAFDLSQNECKRLQNVVDVMLPLEQIENGPAILEHIRKRVKSALQRDPHIMHKLLRSGDISLEALCHNFTHKLTAFYHQAMVHFCGQDI